MLYLPKKKAELLFAKGNKNKWKFFSISQKKVILKSIYLHNIDLFAENICQRWTSDKKTGEKFDKVYNIVQNRDEFDFSPFHDAIKAHQLSAEDDAIAIEKAKEPLVETFIDVSGEEEDEN